MASRTGDAVARIGALCRTTTPSLRDVPSAPSLPARPLPSRPSPPSSACHRLLQSSVVDPPLPSPPLAFPLPGLAPGDLIHRSSRLNARPSKTLRRSLASCWNSALKPILDKEQTQTHPDLLPVAANPPSTPHPVTSRNSETMHPGRRITTVFSSDAAPCPFPLLTSPTAAVSWSSHAATVTRRSASLPSLPQTRLVPPPPRLTMRSPRPPSRSLTP